MVMLSLLDSVHKGVQRTVSRKKDRGEDIVSMRKKRRDFLIYRNTLTYPLLVLFVQPRLKDKS